MTVVRDGQRPLGVLVVAATFPSPIQPWLVNQIDQIVRHQGEVTIVAQRREGETYPSRIDELGLLARTHYHPVSSPAHVLRGIAPLVLPTRRGRLVRRGLSRMLVARWRPDDLVGLVKSVARAEVLGFDYDLVHAHSLALAYAYRHAATIRGVPFVYTFHGMTPRTVPDLPPERCTRLFRDVDVALVNTAFAGRQLESLGCPAERIRILPQGIRLADHPYRPSPFPGEGAVRLLTVGRIQPDKGIRYAIEAVALLRHRGYDVHYTIVGGGPEEASLQGRVAELGMTDAIRLTGRVDERTLHDLYGDSHLFVLPSVRNPLDDHTETQGVVLQEAQASGLLVAASRVGGIPECLDEGRSAVLFRDRDAESIAAAVASLIDRPEMWRTWQDRGRRWVERRFDIDRIGDRLWGVYREALRRRRVADR